MCGIRGRAAGRTAGHTIGGFILPLLAMSDGFAQEAGDEPALEEVIVTGSRLATRDGYEAVTPVTVVDAENLARGTPSNLADALNQLPQFRNSHNERSNNLLSFDTPQAGNNLNLRGVGEIRGLILLDGRRVPPTSFVGTVDVNLLPQMLVERVDIVTAGASAVYGADAVSGVVNYVLDTDFEGLKTAAQWGQSGEGDADTYRLGIAGGTSVLDDRLHLLFSAERLDSDGVPNLSDRPNWEPSYLTVGDGTPDNPYVLEQGVRFSNITTGGLILTGPLAGQMFTPDGELAAFDPGTPTASDGFGIGGDGARWPSHSLTGTIEADALFGRASYDFTSDVTGFVQATWADTQNTYSAHPNFTFGPDITIFSGNPFLPDAAQDVLTATGTESFGMDRLHVDMGLIDNIVDNESLNFTAGLSGTLWDDWEWNAHYTYASVDMESRTTNHLQNVEFAAALDAVLDPAGNVVCRITLTNPGLRDDCVPINVFGDGAPSAEAIAYITDTQMYAVTNDLDEIQFALSGTPWSNWAGDVGLVLGASWREQAIVQTSNANPAEPVDSTGVRGVPSNLRFLAANNGVADGSYDTTEVFTEVAFPLLADQPYAERLELNGAFRLVDYSSFGQEEAWKVGLVYEVTDDLRFRFTQSRDIRSPTLFDLFAGRSAGIAGIFDAHTGISGIVTTEGGGNPALNPEEGETFTVGIGWRPEWLPGFSLSIDYYDIEIKGIISTIPGTPMIQICHDSGHTDPVCDLIVRPLPIDDTSPDNFPISVSELPINLGFLKTDGIDIDATWTSESDAWNLRALINYVGSHVLNNGLGGESREFAGVLFDPGSGGPSIPEWSGLVSATWQGGPWTVYAQERFIDSMSRIGGNIPDAVFADGTDGASAVYYTDLTIEYALPTSYEAELFLSVNNLFDEDPPLLAPINYNPGVQYPTALSVYDTVGRYFTVGARLDF
jgi:outer membrane receptor protein involved in Fe transport